MNINKDEKILRKLKACFYLDNTKKAEYYLKNNQHLLKHLTETQIKYFFNKRIIRLHYFFSVNSYHVLDHINTFKYLNPACVG